MVKLLQNCNASPDSADMASRCDHGTTTTSSGPHVNKMRRASSRKRTSRGHGDHCHSHKRAKRRASAQCPPGQEQRTHVAEALSVLCVLARPLCEADDGNGPSARPVEGRQGTRNASPRRALPCAACLRADVRTRWNTRCCVCAVVLAGVNTAPSCWPACELACASLLARVAP